MADVRKWDWVIALVVGVIQVFGSLGANANQPQARALDAIAVVALLAGPAALTLRSRHPLPVFAVALTAAAAYVLGGYGFGPIFLSVLLAFLTLAASGSRWRTYPLVPLGYLIMVWPGPVLAGAPAPSWWAAAGIAAWLCVVLALAEAVRQRRAVLDARRQREAAGRRSAEEERLRRASEERLAIARELHDVLAHSLSLINVQSGVALELLERKPEHAASALAAIKAASKDALGDVHALLQSIRSAEGAPTAPVPSIADLDALVARARAAGLDVQTQVDGPVRKLPTVVDVAAARIVQESLTNVVRHANGSKAFVTTQYSPTRLRIVVDDDGRGDRASSSADGRGIARHSDDGPATVPEDTHGARDAGSAPSGGNGIRGMIERARALGGELMAGPRPDGGFRVDAVLPAPSGTSD